MSNLNKFKYLSKNQLNSISINTTKNWAFERISYRIYIYYSSMLQKEKVPHKLSRLLREKRFILDCNNYNKSKYQQYNSFKDKYLGYIVSYPRNQSVSKPSRSKLIKNLMKTQIVQNIHMENSVDIAIRNITQQNTQPSELNTSKQYKNMGSKKRLKEMMHNNWLIR